MVQIDIDDCPHPNQLRNLGSFIVAQMRTVFIDDLSRVLNRLVEQALQSNGVSRASLVRATILAEHRAETDVAEFGRVEAHSFRGGKQQLKVFALARVNDVQAGVGFERFNAVSDRREIGRRVGERSVRLPHDEWSGVPFDEDARRPLARAGEAPSLKLFDDPGQHWVVPALAESHVELDTEPPVDRVERGHALRHELVPQPFVFDIALVQLGRFATSQLGDLRMSVGERLQRGIGFDGGNLLLGRGDLAALVIQVLFGLASGSGRTRRGDCGAGQRIQVLFGLASGSGGVLVGQFRRGSSLSGGQRPLQHRQLSLHFRQTDHQRVIVRQLVDQPVQAGQFRNGIALVGRIVPQMLVTVDDHPELSPPVSDVVVGEHPMSEELEDSIQGIADHRAAQVSDVHRLGHVR